MKKKIFVSLRENHEVMDKVIQKLQESSEFDIILHRPFKDIVNLEEIIKTLREVDYIILKASNKISLDILYFAKLYNIPTLHDFDTVITCRSKITLDSRLRQIIAKHKKELANFILPIPPSWVGLIDQRNLENFKEWAASRLPLVIKSHDQHDKFIRFSYLVRSLEEIDDFCQRFDGKLNYAVYVQKAIDCDNMDRKLYVVGDQVFGIRRESPIEICLRENLNYINADEIEKHNLEIDERTQRVAKILSKELNLKLFGFDLIKLVDRDRYYLIDVNDFPGYRGIPNIDKIIVNYLEGFLKTKLKL